MNIIDTITTTLSENQPMTARQLATTTKLLKKNINRNLHSNPKFTHVLKGVVPHWSLSTPTTPVPEKSNNPFDDFLPPIPDQKSNPFDTLDRIDKLEQAIINNPESPKNEARRLRIKQLQQKL